MEDILTKFAQKNLGMDGPVSKEEIEEFFMDHIKEYGWRMIARMGNAEHKDDTWDYLYIDDSGIEITLNPNIKGFRFSKNVNYVFRLKSGEFSTWDYAYEDGLTHFEKYYKKFRDLIVSKDL